MSGEPQKTEETEEESESYEYITAIVECGELSWEYKVAGSSAVGRMKHDEDVTDWSDEDIENLTMSMLNVDESQRGIIKVEYC